MEKLEFVTKGLKEKKNNNNLLSKKQIEQIEYLEINTRKVRSPLQDLEYKLHHWVAFLIIPVFALSNAGVIIGNNLDFKYYFIFNIAISLFLGKIIGVSLFTYIGVKLKFTELPSSVNLIQIIGISILAGVGFTMSIFIANLAFFETPAFIGSAKIGILIGSIISGILGYIIIRWTSKNKN